MSALDGVGGVFEDYLRVLVGRSPVAATRLGDHSHDFELDDWPPEEADSRARELSGLRQRLVNAVDGDDVAADVAGDATLLACALDAALFELTDLRRPSTDPLFYLDLATGGVHDLLRRDDLPAWPRAQAAGSRAAEVPRLLDQAKANLTEVAAPHREVALLRAEGAATLFGQVLPAFDAQTAETGAAAAAACRDFAAWLRDTADAAAPDWRLGERRFQAALRLALGVDADPQQLQAQAEAALEVLQAEAEELTARMGTGGADGRARVRAALDEVAVDRPGSDTLVDDARAVLDEITAFLRATGDFPLPEPDTLTVTEMPAYQQGVAVAFFVPAPPLEPSAPATYYLSPVPAGWDEARATSFLREYNRSALRSVGVHEAYPGHHVQLHAAGRHPRLARRVLWNSAFAEGWAVYAEREVVAAGLGQAVGGPTADAHLRLTSLKLSMRAVSNALLDAGLHMQGWDDARARRLLVEHAYQEDSEATGKIVRGKVTAGQLSTYFVGSQAMTDLRRAAEEQAGAAFRARDFHAAVLAQGTPPFEVLRAALLPDKGE